MYSATSFPTCPIPGNPPIRTGFVRFLSVKVSSYRMLMSSIMVRLLPLPSSGMHRNDPVPKSAPGGQSLSACHTGGMYEKKYRYDLRRSDGFSRSLTFPGLGFFYEFAFAACFFKNSDCGVGGFLKRFFCFLVIGCCHFDPVDRCTQIQQLDVCTCSLCFAGLF